MALDKLQVEAKEALATSAAAGVRMCVCVCACVCVCVRVRVCVCVCVAFAVTLHSPHLICICRPLHTISQMYSVAWSDQTESAHTYGRF